MKTKIRSSIGVAVWLALLLLGMPELARAGCGCDHPPPTYSEVMPPFGSPGRRVMIHPIDGGQFVPLGLYTISFGSTSVTALAGTSDVIVTNVPASLAPGPVVLRVRGPGYDETYPGSAFTALPAPVVLSGSFIKNYRVSTTMRVAVTADGTAMLPIDVSSLRDAAQLAFEFGSLALRFGHDDVVFYNADGVDLTLFTLAVEDPTQRQWGSYYGWDVMEDANVEATVYDYKVVQSTSIGMASDMLTYWRHEFWTYYWAHMMDASHWVNADGYHRNGTFHVDHDQLVIAISGKTPNVAGELVALAPGSLLTTVGAYVEKSANPIEPADVARKVAAAVAAAGR